MRVSVVIPCYNAGRFLVSTLRSALAQTRRPDEILVIDDGSTDGSGEIAGSFDATIRVIRQARRGISGARNRGLDECTGDIVAYLDADDLWYPQKLERQLAYLSRHADIRAVTCDAADYENDVEIRICRTTDALVRSFAPPDFLHSPRMPALSSTLVVAGASALEVRFPETVKDSEDMVYSAMLRTRTAIGHVEDTLAIYRHHPGQLTADPEHWHRRVEALLAWAGRHYASLGAKSATEARAPLLAGVVERVMPHYWSRNVRAFRAERRWLMRIWPAGDPVPPDLRRVAWPRAVFKTRDWLASRGVGLRRTNREQQLTP